MKIEAKMQIKDMPHEINYQLEIGDTITVPDEVGAYWVANGWVKNLDTGEDNEPNNNPVTLAVHNSNVKNTGEHING